MYLSSGDVDKFMEYRPTDRLATWRNSHAAVVAVVVVKVDRKQ